MNTTAGYAAVIERRSVEQSVQRDLFGGGTAEPPISGIFADVVFDRPLDHAFTYAVPEELQESVAVGKRVLVPFGKGDRPTAGFCVRVTDAAPHTVNAFTYRVSSVGAGGSSPYSNIASVGAIQPQSCPPPTFFRATNVGPNATTPVTFITVEWGSPLNFMPAGYEIQWSEYYPRPTSPPPYILPLLSSPTMSQSFPVSLTGGIDDPRTVPWTTVAWPLKLFASAWPGPIAPNNNNARSIFFMVIASGPEASMNTPIHPSGGICR